MTKWKKSGQKRKETTTEIPLARNRVCVIEVECCTTRGSDMPHHLADVCVSWLMSVLAVIMEVPK